MRDFVGFGASFRYADRHIVRRVISADIAAILFENIKQAVNVKSILQNAVFDDKKRVQINRLFFHKSMLTPVSGY